MNDRNVIGAVSAVGFLLVAFTPVIPLLLHNYDVTNEYLIKASVGMASLVCGYGVLWGFFKSDNKIPKSKEGKVRIRLIFVFLGIICICLAWFTNLPNYLSDETGLDQTFESEGVTVYGGIGTRIFVSLITGIGVILIKFAVYREKHVIAKAAGPSPGEYERMFEGGQQ